MLIPFGILSSAGSGLAVSIAGYLGGGISPTLQSSVDKFAFPTDTRTTLGTGLSSVLDSMGAFADSGVAGYFAGGFDGSTRVATVNKFAFPADSRTTLGTGLSGGRRFQNGFANSGTAGYCAGGEEGSPSFSFIAIVDKFAFPADTRTTLGTGLSSNRALSGEMQNFNVAGYAVGGRDSSPNATVATVNKFAFPSDSRTTLGTGLSTARQSAKGFSNSGVAGYAGGGFTTVPVATVDKFAFPTDTRTTLGTGLSIISNRPAGMSDSGTAGYSGGGFDGANRLTRVDKFAFPADTRTTLGTGLSVVRSDLGGMSNEGVF